jgi:cold shock CspA family protein
MVGRVIELRDSFGFIEASVYAGAGGHFFFHRTDVDGTVRFDDLEVGDAVEFDEVIPTPPKGRRASNVASREGGQ